MKTVAVDGGVGVDEIVDDDGGCDCVSDDGEEDGGDGDGGNDDGEEDDGGCCEDSGCEW